MLSVENVNDWLNADIFKRVIANHLNLNENDYEIISIESAPATAPGENFMAFLFRSDLEILIRDSGDKKTLNYITKCLLKQKVYNEEMVSGYAAFPKEKKMYTEFLPGFEKLYKDVGVEVSFGPKIFYSTEDPTDIIVMEFLSDYEMLPKSRGLDIEHVKKSLEWLARFHAASMVYYDLNGSFGDEFKEGIFAMKMENVYQPYYDAYYTHYMEALNKLKDSEKYAIKAEKWKGKLFKLIAKTIEFDENSPNVLCHGDLWSNNLMFKYSEGALVDIKAVDYQIPFYGSPAKDIYNFMMTSWRPDIKIKEFENFIKFYSENLAENLKILNYQKSIPTYEVIYGELMKRKFMMAAMTVELLPFPLIDKAISTQDDLDDSWYNIFYNNPRCHAAFEEIFPWLDELGALDIPEDV